MSYTMDKQVDGNFDETVGHATAALKEEGFGVLCDIDVQQTFEEKLDEEFRQYRILGACNPALAREGLESETKLGVLLPCNVVVYETDDGEIGIRAVDPEALLSVTDNPDLDPIADDVRGRFQSVLNSL